MWENTVNTEAFQGTELLMSQLQLVACADCVNEFSISFGVCLRALENLPNGGVMVH
jgi:hypothetical protein